MLSWAVYMEPTLWRRYCLQVLIITEEAPVWVCLWTRFQETAQEWSSRLV